MRIVFAFLFMLIALPAQAQTDSGAWHDSVRQLTADIRAIHPDPFSKVGSLTFARAAAAFEDDLPKLSDEQRMVRAMKLVALIGDGHTQLEPTGAQWRLWYPVRIVQFADGYFVTSAHRSMQELAGAQVLEMGGTAMHSVAEAARDLMGADNAFDHKTRMYAVHNAPLMRGLGFAAADGSIRIKVRLRSGKVVERTLQPQPQNDPRFINADTFLEWVYPSEAYGLGIGGPADWIAAYGNTPSAAFQMANAERPIHLTERTNYFGRSIPERSAYYIQIHQIDDTSFLQFIERALSDVEKQKPRHLIIDMRNNFGGDASRALEAVHSFVRREQPAPWGQLYVLTGPKTFSAAVLTLDELLDNVPATLVGEPAAAPLNFYGDTTGKVYPKAGFRAEISTLWHQKSDSGDIRSFLPVDVPAPFTFADYVNGRDSAVDSILSGTDMRSIPQIIRAEGGAKAREVYRLRTAQFGKLDWYTPPTEIELRRACTFLLENKRVDEGVEACKLTTEIHPFVWNSWYNLGQAQRAAGLRQEMLASFRCVLALEPTNFNGPGLRRAIASSPSPVVLPAGCPVQDR